MPSEVVVHPGTDARSGALRITNDMVPCTLCAFGLAGDEEVDVLVQSEDPDVSEPLRDSAGTLIKITASQPQVSLTTPIYAKFMKDATAAVARVEVHW